MTSAAQAPAPANRAGVMAAAIATRIPLVHLPARARFPEWRAWGALRSPAARGTPPGPSSAEQLRDSHVFAYGGPSCYTRPSAVGDAAVYFAPEIEASATGSATPFDSGALVEPDPCLQPWAALPESERWTRFKSEEVPLDAWREAFREWLTRCYDEPERYLDTHGDPYADGAPVRPEPPELTEHNGTKGRAQYTRCADRRAWTWEIRLKDEARFEHACVLHVPFDYLDEAQKIADEIERAANRPVEVKTLPMGVRGSPREIYRDSGRVLREVIGP